MKEIKKEHILAAIKEIEANPLLRKGRASSTYDLIYEGKDYPPKLVISIANRYATGIELDPNTFSGGLETPAFILLEKEGFEINKKTDPIKLLIDNYKKYIESSQLKDEVYKWELISEFKGRPNTDAKDFYQEIKSLKFKNLVYAMGIAVLNHLAKNKPEELRGLFKNLFYENKDLTERIDSFNTDTLKIYRDLGDTLQHHQDERSIATYLTYHDSERYTFFKSSVYKKYCQLLGIQQASKNEKYVHYLQLINDFIKKYINPDSELVNQVKIFMPKYYDGSNNLLLAQDILYTMLEKEPLSDNGIFELIEKFVEQGKTTDLKTSIYPKEFNGLSLKVSFGQGVSARIPWIALSKNPNTIQKGIYPVFLYYKEYNKLVLAYGLSETEKSEFKWNNTENLLTIKDWHIKEFNKVPDRYGTSFIKNVYDLGTDLDKEIIDKDLNEILAEYEKINFGIDTAINYWVFQGNPKLYDIVGALKTNAIKTWTVSAHKDKIKIGDKLILWMTGSNSGCYALGLVTSTVSNRKEVDLEMNFYLKPTEQIDNSRVTIEIEHNFFNNPILWNKIKDDAVFKKFKGGNQGTNFSATENEYNILLNMASNNKISESPLNQILYGPPGTGKTYNTVLEAAKIVTGNEAISYDDALKTFNDNLGTQIEFITFHQNYSYEDFIQGIRPDTENGKELTFEKKDGVFKRIADRALKNLIDIEKPESAKKDFDIVFQEFISQLNEDEEIEVKMKQTSFYITQVSEKSIEFRKNQGDSQHTLSINTLRKMYNDGVNKIILGGLQPYYNPILKVLLEKGKSQFSSVEKKNFVIIIDEINRANISRVFGELITLIEEDKRSNGAIPMRVTLPSGDTFIVPSNLYIIGTMNTSDKSIALLDIALRRRFDFVPMYPLYDGLEKPIYDAELLQKINDAILSRKNHDFTIGHAYFMGNEYVLENTLNRKVIPLLLEYFMNDEKEVTAILQVAGIKIGGWPLKMIL